LFPVATVAAGKIKWLSYLSAFFAVSHFFREKITWPINRLIIIWLSYLSYPSENKGAYSSRLCEGVIARESVAEGDDCEKL